MSMTIKDILDWSKHLEKEHAEKPPYWHLQQLRAILELQIKPKQR